MDSEIRSLVKEIRVAYTIGTLDTAKIFRLFDLIEQQPKIDPTVQSWVLGLPLMQQAVLLSALRGPDGTAKESGAKHLIRWYRRCILITAFERQIFRDMRADGGGSFTGPVPYGVDPIKEFFAVIDELPFHFTNHFMNAVQILAYKHPYAMSFWATVYNKWCKKLHCKHPETCEEMDVRLGDNESAWRKSE